MNIDRFLQRASSLSTPLGPPPCSRSFSVFLSSLHPLVGRPFRSSLATILYYAVTLLPRLPPLSAYSSPRVFLFPLFSSRILFFTILLYGNIPSRLLLTLLVYLSLSLFLFCYELGPNKPAQQAPPTPKTRKFPQLGSSSSFAFYSPSTYCSPPVRIAYQQVNILLNRPYRIS